MRRTTPLLICLMVASVLIYASPAGAAVECDIIGTAGDDLIVGTAASEVICGLGGNDTIRAGKGSDVIYGGPGDDTIYAGRGHDKVDAGTGDDTVDGQQGRDRIYGRSGSDILEGGRGRDRLRGGPGIDGCTDEVGPVNIRGCEQDLGQSSDVSELDIVDAGGIRVAASIADSVVALLDAAAADGFVLSGGGFRDPAAQVALRRVNCGTSHYAIWEMPASECSPPTAIPGRSQHELGLAIDFTNDGRLIRSTTDPAYLWLAEHAADFGFYVHPVEPWHWSTTGD